MTRETKIGLLVGLAFIIIVGILLSEPLNHAGDAQPAPLPFAGANVRNGVTAPGAANAAPPITMQNNGSDAKQPVLTHDEVTKPHGGIEVVVGGPSGNPPTSTPLSHSTDNETPAPTHPNNVTVARGNDQPKAGGHEATPAPNTNKDDILKQFVRDNNDELVPVGTHTDTKPQVNNTKPKAAKQYQAVAGDTLSKIAQKFYGSSSKNYRDAIVAANASLKADPNKIINGQTYAIPAVETASVNTPPVAPTPTPTPVVIDNKTKPAASEHFYTVKPGDNLWAIAREECGDAAAVSMLKELNKDALKGTDIVKAGMKLRLPGKPVASVN